MMLTSFCTVTVQNVDGLDIMSGLPKDKSIAVHGSYTSAQCVRCYSVVPIDTFVAELVGKHATPPLCRKPKCRAFS
jgi:NAD-dependent SIR2 family protein deacetylase